MRRDLLAPPRSLLLVLFVVTAAAVGALGGFGWTLLEQERQLEAQRARERLDDAADAAVARARAALARVGEDLNAMASGTRPLEPADGFTTILFDGASVRSVPDGRLLFLPGRFESVPTPGTVAAAEALEFTPGGRQDAIRTYRVLATSADPTVQAHALVRLGRSLRATGDISGALRSYRELAEISAVRLEAGPADLVGREAAATLAGGGTALDALRSDLLATRWKLNRGQFEFYWAQVAGTAPLPRERLQESMAAADLWQRWRRGSATAPHEFIRFEALSMLMIQRRAAERAVVALVRPDWLAREACDSVTVACELSDESGAVAEPFVTSAGPRSVRAAALTRLPVTITVGGRPGAGGLGRRRGLLAVQMAGTMALLLAGAYVIGRAIRRDAETARLQSEFVAAVSHEFRSPLTSIRQLSEMLAQGRAPDGERRQTYYDSLVTETDRLQRLVETLLDFGRMEAGARQYNVHEVGVRDLVAGVSREFAAALEQTGRTIQVSATSPECRVRADADALALALRNLVDNALKYSPAHTGIRIDWADVDGCIWIRVHDEGMGIPASERDSIFRKFVRGRSAGVNSIKGTGLGLAMVNHIAASHGGAVDLQSEVGQGSTFSIILPAVREA
jgi:signal transduction histidine kinase